MNNQELLFNLLKAKDKGEIEVVVNGSGAVFLRARSSSQFIFLFQIDQEIDWNEKESASYYEEKYNEPFRESFYQEKGLDKCWVKECPNKIYQSAGDYQKIKILCQDKHTRMICLACADQLPESKKQPEKINKNHDN